MSIHVALYKKERLPLYRGSLSFNYRILPATSRTELKDSSEWSAINLIEL